MTLAQDDINKIYFWFQSNLLTINTSKTSFMIFKAKSKKLEPYEPLTINNVPLKENKEEKYLGLRIDANLTWNAHIDHIKSKLASLMGSLRPVVRCLPRQVRSTIYNSLVKSHLLYLIEIWGYASKTKLAELQRSQNKIIKLLFHYPYLTRTAKIYNETKLMNINQLFLYNICSFIYKIDNKLIHTNIKLPKKTLTHLHRSSRRPNNLILPKIRTNYGRKTVNYAGAQQYNKLPAHIRSASTLSEFKRKLTEYILKNTPITN